MANDITKTPSRPVWAEQLTDKEQRGAGRTRPTTRSTKRLDARRVSESEC
jgi:hypothetical protein